MPFHPMPRIVAQKFYQVKSAVHRALKLLLVRTDFISNKVKLNPPKIEFMINLSRLLTKASADFLCKPASFP